jgi:hypothetical protein
MLAMTPQWPSPAGILEIQLTRRMHSTVKCVAKEERPHSARALCQQPSTLMEAARNMASLHRPNILDRRVKLRTPWHSTGMSCVKKHKFDGCTIWHSIGMSCVYKHKFHGCLSDRIIWRPWFLLTVASMAVWPAGPAFTANKLKNSHVAPAGKTTRYIKSAIWILGLQYTQEAGHQNTIAIIHRVRHPSCPSHLGVSRQCSCSP